MNNDITKMSQGDFKVKPIDAKIDPNLIGAHNVIGAHTHTINIAGSQHNHHAPQSEYEIVGMDHALQSEYEIIGMDVTVDQPEINASMIAIANPDLSLITINGANQKPLVQIDLEGHITYGHDYNPDAAAEIFWDAMAVTAPKIFGDLEKMTETACSHGHYNYDEYLYGMANGLILALATAKNEEPNYLDRPEQWLCDMDAPRPTMMEDSKKACSEIVDAELEEVTDVMANKMREFVDNEILEELKEMAEEQATDNYERSMKGL